MKKTPEEEAMDKAIEADAKATPWLLGFFIIACLAMLAAKLFGL